MLINKKKEICFIRAKLKEDYVYDAIKNYGYSIHIPYKDKNIFLRLSREIWFRLKLPGKRFWYNKECLKEKNSIYIIYDPLLIPDYFEWLKENNPQARIILNYGNRADTTINPNSVGAYVEKWSYDYEDCEKYCMKYIHPAYLDTYSFEPSKYAKKWDVLYLGRDKGRIDKILEYEKLFNQKNYKTLFRICPDRSYMRYKDKRYKKNISYFEYLELLKKSKALLNVAREDQKAITQRELECVFDGIKCITTNKMISDFELFDESRFFVIDDKINWKEFDTFMNTPFKPIERKKLQEYTFENVLSMYI